MLGTSTLLGTTRHTLAFKTIATDVVRRVKSSVVTSFDTGRQLITNMVAFFIVDLKRNIRADTSTQTDTQRQASVGTQLAADGMRRVLTSVGVLANTVRQLISNGTDLVNVDVVRILRVTIQARFDTQRLLQKLTHFVSGTLRKVAVKVPFVTDVFRKVRGLAMFNTDSIRRLRKATQFVADAIRRKRVQSSQVFNGRRRVRVTALARADNNRRLSKLIQAITDTKRRAATVVQLTTDTARRTLRRYVEQVIVDTIRQILSILVREAPVYDWAEVDLRYDYGELDSRYSEAEKDYSYSWEGDEMKSFTLGEEKVVGVEVTAQDGTPFSIVTATYSYKDMGGNILASGVANVDGSNVFILLAPQAAGFGQKVVFTIQLQPLTAGGDPDMSKSREIIKPVVKVEVAEE